MDDPFLIETGVSDEQDAMKETLKAALAQRQNTVYSRPAVGKERKVFRTELAKALRAEAKRYVQPTPVSDVERDNAQSETDSDAEDCTTERELIPALDAEHCEAIRRISENFSTRFGEILKDKRFRYGTAQKALNLYLKFLWRLGLLGDGKPPHCPADGTILEAAGLRGKSWTWLDDEKEYVRWIEAMRKVASPLDLADWEYQTWRPQASKPKPCA